MVERVDPSENEIVLALFNLSSKPQTLRFSAREGSYDLALATDAPRYRGDASDAGAGNEGAGDANDAGAGDANDAGARDAGAARATRRLEVPRRGDLACPCPAATALIYTRGRR